MTNAPKSRSEVLRLSENIKSYVGAGQADPYLMGAALIEVGLDVALAEYRRPVSRAEVKLIRAHFPNATGEGIRDHRLAPEGIERMLSLVVAIARKYLDHQPEACSALDACPDDGKVEHLVASITAAFRNAYATAPEVGLSVYDIAAASLTNASILADLQGVSVEQIAIIHLEGIARALERGART